MQEHLLGYLLGALDEHEHAMVEAELARDPELRRALEVLRDRLLPLEALEGEYEPPEGLAEVTCARVAAEHEQRFVQRRRPEQAVPPRPHWTFADMAVAVAILIAGAMLFFPAIANSRHAAQLMQCQNNLREIGFALGRSSELDEYKRFPAAEPKGNLAFAGATASKLVDSGYLADERSLICPTSNLASRVDRWSVPTIAELQRARGAHLELLQLTAGGSYGFPLPYVHRGRLVSPRNWGRSHHPIVTDTPNRISPDRHSANHGGLEHNVLYEDLHVQRVSGSLAEKYADHPLLNRHGQVAAGLDLNDAVIGSSPSKP